MASAIGAAYALDACGVAAIDQEDRWADAAYHLAAVSAAEDIMNAAVADPGRKATRNRVDQPRLAPTGAARELLANHPHFRGRADRFRLELCDGALIVEGVVPSFYLKQLLQQVLRDVRGVRRIQNRVAVVNACGLSSHDQR